MSVFSGQPQIVGTPPSGASYQISLPLSLKHFALLWRPERLKKKKVRTKN